MNVIYIFHWNRMIPTLENAFRMLLEGCFYFCRWITIWAQVRYIYIFKENESAFPLLSNMAHFMWHTGKLFIIYCSQFPSQVTSDWTFPFQGLRNPNQARNSSCVRRMPRGESTQLRAFAGVNFKSTVEPWGKTTETKGYKKAHSLYPVCVLAMPIILGYKRLSNA